MSDTQRVFISLYKRAVAEGKFPDNIDTVQAYVAGIHTSSDTRRVLRTLHDAGSNLASLVLLLVIFGVVALLAVIFAAIEARGLINPQGAFYVGFAGLCSLAAAYAAHRMAKEQARYARQQFDEAWADGQFEKKTNSDED